MLKYRRKSPELLERFIKRLRGTEGNVAMAARSLGLSPEVIRTWRKRDKEFDNQIQSLLSEIKETQ